MSQYYSIMFLATVPTQVCFSVLIYKILALEFTTAQHNEVAGVSCQRIPDNITATSVVLTTPKIISNGVDFTNTTTAINNSTVQSTVTAIY